MRAKMLKCLALGVIIAGWTTDVKATPLTWTLIGVTFDDGGTATGSFVFDADTGDYSNISITVAGGSIAGAVYAASTPRSWQEDLEVVPVMLPDLTGSRNLFLDFMEDLTNGGGTIALDTWIGSEEGICDTNDCSIVNILREVSSGVVTAVPEPTTALLLAVGLAGLAAARRRRSLR